MSKIIKSFGICVKQCEIQNRNTNERTQLLQGDLIRILQVDGNKSDKIVVKLYDSEENAFKSDLFECAITDADYVVEDLWFYLIGTQENHIRMRIYNQRNLVLQLKCGSEITIKSYENDLNANIKGVVQLIDTVKEVGIGYFIGFELKDGPENRVTLVSLYKKHFNHSKSMLLFRIDQLLDALLDTKLAVKDLEGGISNTKLNVNAPLFQVGDRTEVSVACQLPKYTRSPIPSLITSPSEIEPNLCMASMANGLSTVVSCISPQTSSIDFICDSKSNLPNSTAKLDHLISNSSLSESETKCVNTDEIKNLSISLSIANGIPPCVQLTDVSIDKKGMIVKRDEPVAIKKKNGRYNESKTKKAFDTSTISSERVYRNIPGCQICSSLFGDDMLTLKCKHTICGKCFGIKASSLTGNSRVQCPFSGCRSQLRRFEYIQLRVILQKLETTDNRLPTTKRNDFDGKEVLLECKNDKREAELYISKLDTDNLFRCPLCKMNNGIHCKAIHEDIIGMVEKLRNLIMSFIPAVSKPAGPQQTLEGAGVPDNIETLTKCINKNCEGRWFILQSDKSTLYKCPTCGLFNCIKCNAIHQNQTCEEYNAVEQPKSSPSSTSCSSYKNIRTYSTVNRNRTNGITGAKRVVNANVKWSCSLCTYDNFNTGRYCYMCRKPNKAN